MNFHYTYGKTYFSGPENTPLLYCFVPGEVAWHFSSAQNALLLNKRNMDGVAKSACTGTVSPTRRKSRTGAAREDSLSCSAAELRRRIAVGPIAKEDSLGWFIAVSATFRVWNVQTERSRRIVHEAL